MIQTSKDKPPKYVVNKIKRKCPGWNYLHYNDEEAIRFFNDNYIEEFKDIVRKFHEMPTGAHKADLFRYYHIYLTGGVFMDSDAMLEENIETITKKHSFFSVKSIVPNSIFQGLIGATPKHIIIYNALSNAYNIEISSLKADYFLLTRNLFKIFNYYPLNAHLYYEVNKGDYAETRDEERVVLKHYYKSKKIPKESIFIWFLIFWNKIKTYFDIRINS